MASIKSKHGLSSPIDAVLLDHDVNDYLADLRLMEGEGLISKVLAVLTACSLHACMQARLLSCRPLAVHAVRSRACEST